MRLRKIIPSDAEKKHFLLQPEPSHGEHGQLDKESNEDKRNLSTSEERIENDSGDQENAEGSNNVESVEAKIKVLEGKLEHMAGEMEMMKRTVEELKLLVKSMKIDNAMGTHSNNREACANHDEGIGQDNDDAKNEDNNDDAYGMSDDGVVGNTEGTEEVAESEDDMYFDDQLGSQGDTAVLDGDDEMEEGVYVDKGVEGYSPEVAVVGTENEFEFQPVAECRSIVVYKPPTKPLEERWPSFDLHLSQDAPIILTLADGIEGDKCDTHDKQPTNSKCMSDLVGIEEDRPSFDLHLSQEWNPPTALKRNRESEPVVDVVDDEEADDAKKRLRKRSKYQLSPYVSSLGCASKRKVAGRYALDDIALLGQPIVDMNRLKAFRKIIDKNKLP